jgi:hypothetical protein
MATPTNSKRIVSDAERHAAIAALRIKGDRYGHAGIAALARELALNLNGDKMAAGAATRIADATGYDKGTVSRVSKVVRTNLKARGAALKLDTMSIDKSQANLDAAVAVGELFKRQPAVKGSGSGAADESNVDVLAVLEAWLNDSTDEQIRPRMTQVQDMLKRIARERGIIKNAA